MKGFLKSTRWASVDNFDFIFNVIIPSFPTLYIPWEMRVPICVNVSGDGDDPHDFGDGGNGFDVGREEFDTVDRTWELR